MAKKYKDTFMNIGKLIPLGDDLTINEVNVLIKPFLHSLNYEERVKLRTSPAGEKLIWVIGEVYRTGYWVGRAYKSKSHKEKKKAQVFE